MGDTAILYPLFAQVLLVFIIQFAMVFARFKAFKRGDVRVRDIAVNNQAWPDDARKSANNYLNQFELPVLFYLLCTLLLVTRSVDYLQVILAWLFVASRYIHAFIHTTYNLPPHRGLAFVFGTLFLLTGWVYFFLHLVQRSLL